MLNDRKFSLLYPRGKEVRYKRIEDSTFHDLGLDVICKEVTSEPKEQTVITEIISNLTSDPDVTNYRQAIFEDLKDLPDVRARLVELFDPFTKARGPDDQWLSLPQAQIEDRHGGGGPRKVDPQTRTPASAPSC